MNMRAIIVLLVLLLGGGTAAWAQTTDKYPEITLPVDSHSFGTIDYGDVVSHTFSFKNTGNAPLIIKDVTTLCGCTVTDYPKAPIAPGKKGNIKVTFNSNGKIGQQHKNVTLHTNCKTETKELKIYAIVKPPAPILKKDKTQ